MDQNGRAEEKSYDDDPGQHEPFELPEKLFPGFNELRRCYHILKCDNNVMVFMKRSTKFTIYFF